MVYPVLQVESLKTRCAADIDTFVKDVLDGNDVSIQSALYDLYIPVLNQEVVSYKAMKRAIEGPLERFIAVLQTRNSTIESFDYAHDILHYTTDARNILWVMRTLLCYQMMIFGTLLMENKALHDTVYAQMKSVVQRPFRPDVVGELASFKLGIFGSITPTSDIDIGIQYSGNTQGFIALHYVVATMEDMFIHFLGIESTLKLDIEYYADMMTLPNPDQSNKTHPDLFYLDTFHFEEPDFKEMLPYAYASIYRNYAMANKHVNIGEIVEAIKTYDPMIVMSHSAMVTMMTTAQRMVRAYTSLSYADARETYYKLVKNAEKHVSHIRNLIQHGDYGVLNNALILRTMKAIAQSLLFRAESYVCAPTVMHVVRVLQNDPLRLKYPVMYPDACRVSLESRLMNPQCEIGKYGYELSRLEQIGYLIRFHITYCMIDHPDAKTKCSKKQKKYMGRLKNAKERMNMLQGGVYRKDYGRHTCRGRHTYDKTRKHKKSIRRVRRRYSYK